jgi:hypothetical protein
MLYIYVIYNFLYYEPFLRIEQVEFELHVKLWLSQANTNQNSIFLTTSSLDLLYQI